MSAIVLLWGTRPESIKLGPIAAELARLGAAPLVISTGQHTDLLKGTPVETDLRGGESLALPSDGNVVRWLDRAERACARRFESLAPDTVIVVQGDTMSALAGARAAARKGLRLAHVEAGVRSHAEEPWPEESFRREIDELADWYYTPTPTTYANLLTEGVESYRLKLTGNSIVSAIARYSKAKPVRPPLARILITLHRREWLLGEQFQHVLDALRQSARDDPRVDFVWPLHPAVQKRIAREWVDSLPPNLVLVTPLAYADSVGVLAECLGVLTDSGGLMEEAATLGVPCACLRNVCDRPEAIDAGVARLFFVNATGVERAVKALVSGELQRRPTDVYGDITAASQIAQHLCMLAA